ncbi:MAG: uracil-DNA glycosylase [Spirochaetes bacterium GWF1_31_7]|nr:MAG: uracil-DNA glycosylase [Spirochaetes bacterium GWE1_32_154]OHD50167.1 MAG: uracil-DNA glycosylase [Spirochaetes bacterium GWE2_31_10]OHD52481.1 MAG: uracil-DNA glycosylase [Spirochaetes bacterium GWF1_31_7]OHD81987.1 MAG: uracil-DNA glycosylase [Spirochaetes bacterium RIFOXYB1_FULL_32_8]HBD94126.1 uracil-DNA glycosylase [Spirochaetia bacterium]
MTQDWKKLLNDEFNKPYFKSLQSFLTEERKIATVYPPENNVFQAFELTPFDELKVVILGQDPYHGENQAHGLCFSVPEGVPQPPSLVNIFKEIQTDINIQRPQSGNLERWAKQGVFLLNTTLTVQAGKPLSHKNKGWEIFTDEVIKQISREKTGVIFLLWGKHAQSKESLIDSGKHYILKAAHPSPLSAYNGFFGCKHFSKTNLILLESGKKEITF